MSVTELAILPLTSGASLDDPAFRAKLLQSRKIMKNALGVAGRRFTYYQGIEDPRVLYLLGDWQSPSEHWDHFIPSPENQQLLELLKDELDIPHIEMHHVDVPNASVPADTEVISIRRHRIRTDHKARFEEQAFDYTNALNENVDGKHKSAAGWRIEKPGDREDEDEWVLFCGWNTTEEHMHAGQTEPWTKDARSNMVLESDIKHGVRIDLEPTSLS